MCVISKCVSGGYLHGGLGVGHHFIGRNFGSGSHYAGAVHSELRPHIDIALVDVGGEILPFILLESELEALDESAEGVLVAGFAEICYFLVDVLGLESLAADSADVFEAKRVANLEGVGQVEAELHPHVVGQLQFGALGFEGNGELVGILPFVIVQRVEVSVGQSVDLDALHMVEGSLEQETGHAVGVGVAHHVGHELPVGHIAHLLGLAGGNLPLLAAAGRKQENQHEKQ